MHRQHLRLVNEPVPPSRFNGISPMVPRPLPDSCPIASPLQSLPLQSPLSPTMPTTPVPSPVQSPLKEGRVLPYACRMCLQAKLENSLSISELCTTCFILHASTMYKCTHPILLFYNIFRQMFFKLCIGSLRGRMQVNHINLCPYNLHYT